MIQTKKIILASQSPRRQELLTKAGIDFDLKIINVEESYPAELNITEIPEFLARKKGENVILESKEQVLITADTIVILENEVIEKPKNEQEAIQMLTKLSNKKHTVITGVGIKTKDEIFSFSNHTQVYFNKLNEKDIIYYVKNYQPLDKAGSYGIQDWIGLRAVEKIEGCFYNVMGLPISALLHFLAKNNLL
jgi:septum formation protein